MIIFLEICPNIDWCVLFERSARRLNMFFFKIPKIKNYLFSFSSTKNGNVLNVLKNEKKHTQKRLMTKILFLIHQFLPCFVFLIVIKLECGFFLAIYPNYNVRWSRHYYIRIESDDNLGIYTVSGFHLV